MKDNGWYQKKGVKILEGKWQDFVDNAELLETGGFDVIYTDTFSEDYSDLRKFFEHLPDLLADGNSRFSFFNGLGATSKSSHTFTRHTYSSSSSSDALFYDVYTRISELHLDGVGFDVAWGDVDIGFEDKEGRWGQSREYFSLPLYRLPIGKMKAVP